MIKVLVSSCEYGDFEFNGHEDKTIEHNGYEIRSIVHTDKESLMTRESMHPRMYGKINKMMNWVLYPDYDFYIWRDSRISFRSNDHIIDFVQSMRGDLGLFKHRFNSSIEQEKNHVLERMSSEYMKKRYTEGLIRGQFDAYKKSGFKQEGHFEGGLFCYSKDLVSNPYNVMSSWFKETMIWSENDQMSLPYSVWEHKISPHVYEGDVLNNKWTTSNYRNYK